METRENELHTPKMSFYETNYKNIYCNLTCVVCKHLLHQDLVALVAQEYLDKEEKEVSMRRRCVNYCPNCGARLK